MRTKKNREAIFPVRKRSESIPESRHHRPMWAKIGIDAGKYNRSRPHTSHRNRVSRPIIGQGNPHNPPGSETGLPSRKKP